MPSVPTIGARGFAARAGAMADANRARGFGLAEDRINLLLAQRQQLADQLGRIREQRIIKKQQREAERAQQAAQIGAVSLGLVGGVAGGMAAGPMGAISGAQLGTTVGQQVGSAAGGGPADIAGAVNSVVPNPFYKGGQSPHEQSIGDGGGRLTSGPGEHSSGPGNPAEAAAIRKASGGQGLIDQKGSVFPAAAEGALSLRPRPRDYQLDAVR